MSVERLKEPERPDSKEDLVEIKRGIGTGTLPTREKYYAPVEDLFPRICVSGISLETRVYHVLKMSGIMRVGEVLEKSRDELFQLRNFAKKSYAFLLERLQTFVEEEEVSLPVPFPRGSLGAELAPILKGRKLSRELFEIPLAELPGLEENQRANRAVEMLKRRARVETLDEFLSKSEREIISHHGLPGRVRYGALRELVEAYFKSL